MIDASTMDQTRPPRTESVPVPDSTRVMRSGAVAAEGYDTATDDVSVPSGGAADVNFALQAVRPAEDHGAASALHDLSRGSQFETVRGAPSDRDVTSGQGFNWYPFSRLFVDFGGLPPEPLTPPRGLEKPSGGVDVSAFGTAANVSLPMGDLDTLDTN